MSDKHTYKVFTHVTGLVLFELVFWAMVGSL